MPTAERPVADTSTVISFLSDERTHGTPVRVIETHASMIFIAGPLTYKMKKAVTYPYLDYGTLERRQHFCIEEARINRRTAPDMYLEPVAVVQDEAGHLGLGIDGTPVEWLVVMHTFDNDFLLDKIASTANLTGRLCNQIADSIHEFHNSAEVIKGRDAVVDFTRIVDGSLSELRRHSTDIFPASQIDRLAQDWNRSLIEFGDLLRFRATTGKVRHLHGDLHLRNIVVWKDKPTLFDAIEFDRAIAEIDTLYDIAFLLMDLLHRDQKVAANAILNRYMQRSADYEGLALLPLYLSLRATIRAHTGASGARSEEQRQEAASYLTLATEVLAPSPVLAVAVGGASGTGKSTVAQALAPELGCATGALVLRSDVIRKRLYGLEPEQKLPADAYSADASTRVFCILASEAGKIIQAGQSIVLDAVFGRESDLAPLNTVLSEHGIRLHGFWLDAPFDILANRIKGRTDDASDADVEVLTAQLPSIEVPDTWPLIDAGGDPASTLQNLRNALPY